MNKNKRLTIITPLLAEELEGYINGFKRNHLPSIQTINQFVDLILVIQGDNSSTKKQLEELSGFISLTVIFTQIKSTSYARNLGIDSTLETETKPSNIIFLDSDSFISKDNWPEIFTLHQSQKKTIHEISVQWEPIQDQTPSATQPRLIRWQKRMFRTYLWSLIVPYELIINSNMRFDESLGPGEKTHFKSGEDTLFLLELFQKNNVQFLNYHPHLRVLHPQRPADNSKKLTYALGQGNLFRVLIANTTDKTFFVYLIGWLSLFLGNTLFMLITFKPNALAIAKMRLKGLIFNIQQGKQIS